MKTSITAITILFLGTIFARAQTYSEYKFVFSGTAYQTNAHGMLTSWHITDQTLLKTRAEQGNITNLNTISIVYHINGDPKGDTVDIIDNNGTYLTTEFGLFYGSDSTYGRTAVGTPTVGERRIDPMYTFDDSLYTYSNSDSVGSAFTYKHYIKGAKGVTNAVINGTMSWAAIPTGTNTSPVLCVGTFSLGRPMF